MFYEAIVCKSAWNSNSNVLYQLGFQSELSGSLNGLSKYEQESFQPYLLEFFQDSLPSTYDPIFFSLGGIYLQGYTVSEQSLGSRRSVIEVKPPSEEFTTFYLCAESVNENQR